MVGISKNISSIKRGIMLIIFKFVAVAIVILLTAFPNAGLAENKAGAVTLNPNIGGYVFEGNQHIDNNVAYGLGLGYNFTENWGVEGNFNNINTDADSHGADDVQAYIYRIDGLYHFMPEKKLVPFVAAGIGAITLNGAIKDDGTFALFNYGGGLKYFLTQNLALRGDVRHILFRGKDDQVNNLIYTLGLTFAFGGEEKKEAVPPPAPEPSQPKDSDGDGVYDDIDKCPDTPKGVAVDMYGCPKDSDGDGVPDYLDKCPDTPKGVAVDINGCPKDSDGDGVPDYLDKCPDTPKGVAVDVNGCPKDSDGDGVPDYLDLCPDTPKGVEVDSSGCPRPVPAARAEKTVDLQDLPFDFDKSTLTEEAQGVLKKNIQTLKENPDVKIRIEGHSCAHGPDDYNLRLSERRANAIKEYLIKEGGISPDRMSTIAYGETRLAMPEIPTPQNKNSIEAKTNRRVHFELIKY
ncbi:MAG: outer membrane beta-barrel domain-containing protein [Nitrospirae bacterium]|nr:outer membrane beta-barrel domain-containing protein [Nitrospirota bacterium]